MFRRSRPFETWSRWLLARLGSLARLQSPHPLQDEIPGSIEFEHFRFRAQDMEAYRSFRGGEQTLPLLDPPEHERHELRALELTSTWVDPDDRLVLLRTEQDHVVVRRNDDLIRRPCVFQHNGVTRTSRRCPIPLVADVAGANAKLAQRAGDRPGEQFVEKKPDRWSRRRNATLLLGERLLGEKAVAQGSLESEGGFDLRDLQV